MAAGFWDAPWRGRDALREWSGPDRSTRTRGATRAGRCRRPLCVYRAERHQDSYRRASLAVHKAEPEAEVAAAGFGQAPRGAREAHPEDPDLKRSPRTRGTTGGHQRAPARPTTREGAGCVPGAMTDRPARRGAASARRPRRRDPCLPGLARTPRGRRQAPCAATRRSGVASRWSRATSTAARA